MRYLSTVASLEVSLTIFTTSDTVGPTALWVNNRKKDRVLIKGVLIVSFTTSVTVGPTAMRSVKALR